MLPSEKYSGSLRRFLHRWLARIELQHLSFLFFFICIFQVFLASSAIAQSWEQTSSRTRIESKVCLNGQTEENCFSFYCDDVTGLQFGYSQAKDQPNLTTEVKIQIDDNAVHSLIFHQVEGINKYGAEFKILAHSNLLQELISGANLTIRTSRDEQFSLRGSSGALKRVLQSCAQIHNIPGTIDEFLSVEKVAQIGSSQVHLMSNIDIWGHDIVSGLEDASLINIDKNQCAARCVNEPQCRAFTHNGQNDLCFLKDGLGDLVPYPKASSGFILSKNEGTRLVQENRPYIFTTPVLRWRDDDTVNSYVERLRTISPSSSGKCEVEMATVRGEQLSIEISPIPSDLQVGNTFELSWAQINSQNDFPTWMVVSSDSPLRFGGEGMFAITPKTIAPFGLTLAHNQTRAFVPLRENNSSASVGVFPMIAGKTDLEIHHVAWLTGCSREVVLSSIKVTVDIIPGAPQIVINDLSEVDMFQHILSVPEFNRVVKLSDRRFQILDSYNHTQILERDGLDVQLSPTKRFVTLRVDGGFEILDIVDGVSLGKMNGEWLAFLNNDSFAVTDFGLFGETWVMSTLYPTIRVRELLTGPSPALSSRDTMLRVDMENAFLMIAGWSKNHIQSLVEKEPFYDPWSNSLGMVLLEENPQEIQSLLDEALTGRAIFSPMEVVKGWTTPGGVKFTHIPDFATSGADGFSDIIFQYSPGADVLDNPKFGLVPANQENFTGDENAGLQLERGTGVGLRWSNNFGLASGFVPALSRWGFEVSEGKAAEMFTTPYTRPKGFTYAGDDYEIEQQTLRSIRRNARDTIAQEIAPLGSEIQWSILDFESNIGTTCNHFFTSESDVVDERIVPGDIDRGHILKAGERTLLIVRASCKGGRSGSSMITKSSLYIYDSSISNDFHQSKVMEFETYFSDQERPFYDADYEVKVFEDKYLVTYALNQGKISVFDLAKREFIFTEEGLPRGDLLQSVFLDKNATMITQLNSDGSFTIYRVDGGNKIINGRYVDDEIVVWTDEFRYDATDEGAAFVSVRFPGQGAEYSFQQFEAQLRVPGLLNDALIGIVQPQTTIANAPPTISGAARIQDGSIVGNIVASSYGELLELRIYQDGVLSSTLPFLEEMSLEFEIPRIIGSRWLSLIAVDAEGYVSSPILFDLGADARGLARTHLLVIGVDRYNDPDLGSLNYAKIDASRFLEAAESLSGKSISLQSSTVLVDRSATEENILSSIKTISETSLQGDHLVIFFAGHGLRGEDGQLYLGGSNTSLRNIAGTSFAWSTFADSLFELGIRTTVLLDACHSGAAGTAAFATNDEAVTAMQSTMPTGLTVLSASKGRQFSGESTAFGGGAFTDAMIDVLFENRENFDVNGNGVIEVSEFYLGVKQGVFNRRGKLQTPWLSRNQQVGDFAVF